MARPDTPWRIHRALWMGQGGGGGDHLTEETTSQDGVPLDRSPPLHMRPQTLITSYVIERKRQEKQNTLSLSHTRTKQVVVKIAYLQLYTTRGGTLPNRQHLLIEFCDKLMVTQRIFGKLCFKSASTGARASADPTVTLTHTALRTVIRGSRVLFS